MDDLFWRINFILNEFRHLADPVIKWEEDDKKGRNTQIKLRGNLIQPISNRGDVALVLWFLHKRTVTSTYLPGTLSYLGRLVIYSLRWLCPCKLQCLEGFVIVSFDATMGYLLPFRLPNLKEINIALKNISIALGMSTTLWQKHVSSERSR